MHRTTKIYTFSIMILTASAVGFFGLPAAKDMGSALGSGNDSIAGFVRCEACHPAGADTTKSSPHYRMECTDCHSISGFTRNTHTSTIPECSQCHAGISAGRQHTKYRYAVERALYYGEDVSGNK